ncbi:hypothetical protein A3D68_00750 [Candidatus Adlerbacteria bacterium RIFCSPHIGHO2_02_FULL_52_17]|uniref:Uncharacterized protein n=1 Tax=Candidatus Adlerbacteria bacterium RIFCSPHIGHO2_02_FULL_52_17 TaxID=1797240 RepID=A0A1F4XP50_9BACT|nr:MAG: hypothetical protein A3D68_00750 [Candidatus Adlerbacteria bacterium RIFCSPHIGHO2_02_FULL_52_17]
MFGRVVSGAASLGRARPMGEAPRQHFPAGILRRRWGGGASSSYFKYSAPRSNFSAFDRFNKGYIITNASTKKGGYDAEQEFDVVMASSLSKMLFVDILWPSAAHATTGSGVGQAMPAAIS